MNRRIVPYSARIILSLYLCLSLTGCIFFGLEENRLLSSLEGIFSWESGLLPVNDELLLVCKPASPYWGPESGFTVVDTSNPFSPKILGAFIPDGDILALQTDGEYVFCKTRYPDNSLFLETVDISEPRLPVKIAEVLLNAGDESNLFYREGDYLLYGHSSAVDISDPAQPVLSEAPESMRTRTELYSTLTIEGEYEHILFLADAAYVSSPEGVRVLDISDPENIIEGDIFSSYRGQCIQSGVLYTSSGGPFAPTLRLYDLSDPLNPVHISSENDIPAYMGFTDISCTENYLYALSLEKLFISIRPGR